MSDNIKKAIEEIKADTLPSEVKKDVISAIKSANEPEIVLTDEQKKIILDKYKQSPEKFRLTDAVRLAFPNDPKADGRSKHGIIVKSYLASLNIKAFGSHVYLPPKTIVLTNQQKEYIANNAKDGPMKITRDIFNNQSLTNLSMEARAVLEFYQTLPPQAINDLEVQEVPDGMYKPPRTLNSVIWKINSYFKDASGAMDKEKLTHKQLKALEALIGYINTYRFIYQINMFETESDRKLFESTFLRHTYDKVDLTQEEVDQYIMVATETVNMTKAWERKEKLQRLMEELSERSEDDKFNATMRLVEAIGKAESAYDDCQSRVNDLLDSLKVKRSKRLEQKIQENASILNLVEAWKAQETRDQIIKVVEQQRENLEKEIQRLDSMEEIKCRILGISAAEVLNG